MLFSDFSGDIGIELLDVKMPFVEIDIESVYRDPSCWHVLVRHTYFARRLFVYYYLDQSISIESLETV